MGNHVFIYRMMTSHGQTRPTGPEPWTIEEIGRAIDQVIHW